MKLFMFAKKTGSFQIFQMASNEDYFYVHPNSVMVPRFDAEKLLLDPYARALSARNYQRSAAAKSGGNARDAVKSVVADLSTYDWEGDRPLDHPFSGTVLYELHVGGFTRNPNS